MQFEQQREHVPSAVLCYMNEFGVSKKEACEELIKDISEAWKILNEGRMRPTPFPFPVYEVIINFCRLVDVLYKFGDCMTFPAKFMKGHIISLLVQPVPI